MKPFIFMVKKDQRDWLRREAFRRQVSIAKLLRDIIEKVMKKR